MGKNPDATLSQILRDSKDERQYVYRWLFRSHSKYGQDNRIRTLLEQEPSSASRSAGSGSAIRSIR